MDTIKLIASVGSNFDRSKERFEMILEPLQAIIQLALLSYCPIGTKLSISENILIIQPPSWGQGLKRKYNSDKKNDLVYLFNVIKRFHKFYNFLKIDDNKDETELFNILVKNASLGLSNLIQTYSHSDGDHLSQTLRMYIQLVEKPESFQNMENDTSINIDTVFSQITDKYETEHFLIILNIFKLLEEEPEEYSCYLESLNHVLSPINKTLKKWISDNIIF